MGEHSSPLRSRMIICGQLMTPVPTSMTTAGPQTASGVRDPSARRSAAAQDDPLWRCPVLYSASFEGKNRLKRRRFFPLPPISWALQFFSLPRGKAPWRSRWGRWRKRARGWQRFLGAFLTRALSVACGDTSLTGRCSVLYSTSFEGKNRLKRRGFLSQVPLLILGDPRGGRRGHCPLPYLVSRTFPYLSFRTLKNRDLRALPSKGTRG